MCPDNDHTLCGVPFMHDKAPSFLENEAALQNSRALVYADYNATTPLCASARKAMDDAISIWGNPSSSHRPGQEAKKLLEYARDRVASATNVNSTEVVFTSGGSEANVFALMGSFFLYETFRLLTSPVEHSSVTGLLPLLRQKGALVETVSVRTGQLDFEDFEKKLDTFKPHLVSLMAANNETGVLFPIHDLMRMCHKRDILLHTDAVQAFGKVASSDWNSADFISISAHKVFGPKGVGALIVRQGHKLIATHYGGSQELKRRGGTENMIGISGFGGACTEINTDSQDVSRLRDRFEDGLMRTIDAVEIIASTAPRLPNTSNVRFAGVAQQLLLTALDLEGIAVSAGSACASGSVTPSHVLLAMGLTHTEAAECIRFSWGKLTTDDDIDRVIGILGDLISRIRSRKELSYALPKGSSFV